MFRKAISEGDEAVDRMLEQPGAAEWVKRDPTSLHLCLFEPKFVARLVSMGADVDGKDGYGRIPLEGAVYNGLNETVEILVQGGADVNYVYEEGGSLLRIAVDNNLPSTVELLLKLGAKPNPPDSFDQTPLQIAIIEQYWEVAKVLLEHGAVPRVGDLLHIQSMIDGKHYVRGQGQLKTLKAIRDLLQKYASSAK
jgi:ankyrin repeat protein